MRNLKKILSLALALVMVMSLLTVAGAREFNDAADIEHTEAVEVMSSLGVINGMGNNTFNPKGNVTRGEMAKMITYISLGNVEPTAFLGTTTNLTDINGHWAEAYIKYCYSQGIISGRGNGIFAPNANVTATEAARMLLVAIGYNADVQVYTGAQWNINVVRDASISGLYEDVSVTSTEVLNRDKAAQMMYNALNAKTIVKTSAVDRVTGDITDTYTANGETLLEKSYDAKVWIGTFAGNHDFNGSNTAAGEIRVNKGSLEENYTDAVTGDVSFPYDYDISNIGEEVKVIFKDGTSGRKDAPDKQDTIYGVYKTGATSVVTGILGDVKDQKSNKAQINIDGTKYDLNETAPSGSTTVVTVWKNFNSHDDYTLAQVKGTSSANSTLTTDLKQSNGNTIKAVLKDGKIDTIYVTESKIAAVTAVNSEKVSMNNGVGTVEFEDNDIYGDIARGDVVVVTTLYSAKAYDDDAVVTVAKAEIVSGTVTGFKTTGSGVSTKYENVTIDGNTYKIHNQSAMLENIPGKSDVAKTFVNEDDDTDIGETFDLYLINGYVGAAVQTSTAASNYSVVLDYNGNHLSGAFDRVQLQVMNASGEKTVITVADDSKGYDGSVVTEGTVATKIKEGNIIVWAGSTDDATVTVKGEYAASGSATQYRDTTKAFDGSLTATDCVLFASTKAGGVNGDVKAYSIRGLRNFDVASTMARTIVRNDDDRVVAVYVDLAGRPGGAAGSTIYGIVSSYAGRRAVDGTRYYQYTVDSNDSTYTININSSTAVSKGDLVYFDPAADEIYSTGDLHVITKDTPKMQAVYVDEYDEADKTLSFFTGKTGNDTDGYEGTGSGVYALDDDCAIVFVDVDDDKAGSNIGINSFDPVKGYKNAVIITETQSGDEVIVAILVETSNKANILDVADVISGNANEDDVQETINNGSDAVVDGNLTSASALDLKGKDLTVDGNSSITGAVTANGGNVTLNGAENSVTGAVTLAGGTLTLNGSTSNSVTGGIDLGTSAKAGTVEVKKDATISGAITGTGTLNVAKDATLTLGSDVNLDNVTITGAGEIDLTGDLNSTDMAKIIESVGAVLTAAPSGSDKDVVVSIPANIPSLSGTGKVTEFNGAQSLDAELANSGSTTGQFVQISIPAASAANKYILITRMVNDQEVKSNGRFDGTSGSKWESGDFDLTLFWGNKVDGYNFYLLDEALAEAPTPPITGDTLGAEYMSVAATR